MSARLETSPALGVVKRRRRSSIPDIAGAAVESEPAIEGAIIVLPAVQGDVARNPPGPRVAHGGDAARFPELLRPERSGQHAHDHPGPVHAFERSGGNALNRYAIVSSDHMGTPTASRAVVLEWLSTVFPR